MAGMLMTARTTAAVALTGGVEKTVLQVKAPANVQLKIARVAVFFNGTSSAAEPVQIQGRRNSTDGAGTSAAPLQRSDSSTTAQATAAYDFSAEPTSSAVLIRALAHPQTGFEWIAAPGQEILVPGGGRFGIAVNAPASVSAWALIEYEE